MFDVIDINERNNDAAMDTLALLAAGRLITPDLLMAECANVFWKKTASGEFTPDEARLAARLAHASAQELVPMRSLAEQAAVLACRLNHPAYECVSIALALDRKRPIVTADRRLVETLRGADRPDLKRIAVKLGDPVRSTAFRKRGKRFSVRKRSNLFQTEHFLSRKRTPLALKML